MDENQNETTPKLSQMPASPSTEAPLMNPSAPNIEKPKSIFPLTLVIAAIFFILIAGSVAGFYFYKQQSLKTAANPASIKDVPKQTPSPIPDPTADWKTYTDSKLGFVFRYPQEYSITKNAGGPFPGTSDILNHNIMWRKVTLESISNCRGDGCRFSTNTTPIRLGSNSINKVNGLIGEIGGNISENFIDYEITIPNSTDLIIFRIKELPSDKKYQDLVKQFTGNRSVQEIPKSETEMLERILATFKFTFPLPQQTQIIDISTWKTYSNNTYNYSLKVPTDWVVNTDNAKQNNDTLVFITSGDFKVFGDTQVPHLSSGAQLEILSKFAPDVTKSYDDFITYSRPDKTQYPNEGKQITIDGEKAILWTSDQAYAIQGQSGYQASVFHNGRGYLIEMVSALPQDLLLSQVLSTFKFNN